MSQLQYKVLVPGVENPNQSRVYLRGGRVYVEVVISRDDSSVEYYRDGKADTWNEVKAKNADGEEVVTDNITFLKAFDLSADSDVDQVVAEFKKGLFLFTFVQKQPRFLPVTWSEQQPTVTDA